MKNLNNKLENRLNRKIVDKLYVQITKNQDREIVWKMSDELLIKQLKNKLKDGKSQ
jgi:hypothetical protein